ncbi:MAG: HAD hydrolase family protein [bacterium]|nr:HAD hydrolase family protein [bacterium]
MAELKNNAQEKAKNIKLLAFDVDGVLTDGSITYDENGVEYKTFNVKDGHGLVRMQKTGFITAIITARNNGTVEHRAKNLNITELCQGQKYKLPALDEILKKYNFTYENVAYMGDDIPDLCILEKIALACCPNDAVDEVLNVCNFISSKNGGRGAVRELCDFILESQNIPKIPVVAEGQEK